VTRDLLTPTALGIYLLTFLSGVAGALVLPTLSLFFAEEISVSPFWVGVPFAGMAIGSIVYNQAIGEWSDKLSQRRNLTLGLCLVGVITCAVLAVSRHYALTAFLTIACLSLAMVSFSQILAYSLEYAESSLPPVRVALFNALVRAQMAFAWVAGPPVGFFIVARLGFTALFVVTAGLFAVVAVLCLWLLPGRASRSDEIPIASGKPDVAQQSIASNKPLLIALAAFSILWGVNNAYLISIPLHVSRNLGLETEWVGWLMSATAALEVPVMLAAGYLATRLPLLLLVRLSGLAAIVLYLGIFWGQALWHLFALQLANALFIGILAGLGVSVVQVMLPGRAGSASALYTNTTHLGTLLSSVLIATVAEMWGYRSVFLANALLVMVAIGLFFAVRLPAAPLNPNDKSATSP